ncbi:MAG TPA: 4Fe-4S dicluster domain-containing protein, partial [Proteobacteria bacterium]|nr:4Fe-4S dicluster domain-containing protein [Pseudomonadota bacterium]
IRDGISYVNRDMCTGCGKCVEVCPRDLIMLLPESQKVFILCSSHDKGAVVRKICQVGCIGCRRCLRACAYDAIEFEGNLARIIVDKCTNCGACAQVCPTGAIVDLAPRHAKVEIDPGMCDGCGACKEICPAGAISGDLGDKHEVDATKCLGCGACISACPKGAIAYVGNRKTGAAAQAGADDVA